MPDLADSDAKILDLPMLIPGVERWCLINNFRGCIFSSKLAPLPSFLCLLVFSNVIPVVRFPRGDFLFFFKSAHADTIAA